MDMINIRVATHSDIELINSLAARIFLPTYRRILSTEQMLYMFDMMYSLGNIKAQMLHGAQYFIIESESEPCGYISISKKGEQHYYIDKIYTLPSMHGTGAGCALFNFACDYTIEQSEGKEALLELNVNRHNQQAIDFYSKRGMRIDRQTDEHIGDGYYANDYVMTLKLPR